MLIKNEKNFVKKRQSTAFWLKDDKMAKSVKSQHLTKITVFRDFRVFVIFLLFLDI